MFFLVRGFKLILKKVSSVCGTCEKNWMFFQIKYTVSSGALGGS